MKVSIVVLVLAVNLICFVQNSEGRKKIRQEAPTTSKPEDATQAEETTTTSSSKPETSAPEIIPTNFIGDMANKGTGALKSLLGFVAGLPSKVLSGNLTPGFTRNDEDGILSSDGESDGGQGSRERQLQGGYQAAPSGYQAAPAGYQPVYIQPTAAPEPSLLDNIVKFFSLLAQLAKVCFDTVFYLPKKFLKGSSSRAEEDEKSVMMKKLARNYLSDIPNQVETMLDPSFWKNQLQNPPSLASLGSLDLQNLTNNPNFPFKISPKFNPALSLNQLPLLQSLKGMIPPNGPLSLDSVMAALPGKVNMRGDVDTSTLSPVSSTKGSSTTQSTTATTQKTTESTNVLRSFNLLKKYNTE